MIVGRFILIINLKNMYENEIIARVTFVDKDNTNVLLDTTDIEVFKTYFPFNTNMNVKLPLNEVINLHGKEYTIYDFVLMVTQQPLEKTPFYHQKNYPYSLRVMVCVSKK